MKLGIIGLPGSGKTTVFDALTQSGSDMGKKGDNRISTSSVPDKRVDVLSSIYKPKKTIYAQVEYLLPGKHDPLRVVRESDALIHVIRNFKVYGLKNPEPYEDFCNLDQELILLDLVVAEKRLEKLTAESKKGKKGEPEELLLLNECCRYLNEGIPLRNYPHIGASPLLRGYAFLSAKPMLVLFNNEDDDEILPDVKGLSDRKTCMVIRAKLEQELAQMSKEEASDFLSEFGIAASAKDRVISRSYEMMGLISFFTVGDDEVRAWTIKKGTQAIDAAEVIHTDLKKGFIRAEVLSYNDFMAAGSFAEARKRGTVRLEGKTYVVEDGDIITIRFNV
jgi:ribosome-binding ATPase YchF (GTP1/OBG family)